MFNNILIFLPGLKSSILELTFSLQKSSSFLTCGLIFDQLLPQNITNKDEYNSTDKCFYIYMYNITIVK